MSEIKKTEVGEKLEKLGIKKLVFLNRNQIEKLFARHFAKSFIHVSTVFGGQNGEISATLCPEDAPPFFSDHHPGGEKKAPGVNLVELVNQSVAAFSLAANPNFGFFLREIIFAKFKSEIGPGDSIRAEIKIIEIKTRGEIATVVAEAKIFKNDSEKPAALVKIKGAGGEKS